MIYFVGGGPGDRKLITVWGMELLKMAGAVLYTEATIGKDLFVYLRGDCKVVSSKGLSLSQIVNTLVDLHGKSDVVVRLHSGDVAIYSAISEEIEEIERLGIPYAVVPGVSAYSVLAARVGMELTVPGVTQSVLITRLPGRTGVPEDIDVLLSQQPACAIYLSGSMADEVLQILKRYYPSDAILVVGHRVGRDGEVVVSNRLEEWNEVDVPSELTLFLIRKGGSGRSFLYGERE